jgi:hypothetical protein
MTFEEVENLCQPFLDGYPLSQRLAGGHGIVDILGSEKWTHHRLYGFCRRCHDGDFQNDELDDISIRRHLHPLLAGSARCDTGQYVVVIRGHGLTMSLTMRLVVFLWAMLWSAVALAAPLTAVPPVAGPFISSFPGADLTGRTDSSAALASCLGAAGPGGVCFIDNKPGTKLLINSTVLIPDHGTIDCGLTFPDNQDGQEATYATMPAILLSSAASLKGGGLAPTIRNCLIYRSGMTFPAADASLFAGTAVDCGGQHNCTLVNDEILGFDKCVEAYGVNRLWMQRVYVDCSGIASASIRIGGNGDLGFLDDIKLQPLATGNPNCAAGLRNGRGFYIFDGGGYEIGSIISQNFKLEQFRFEDSSANHAKMLWADFLAGCAKGVSSGLFLRNGADNTIEHFDVNGVQTGALIENDPWGVQYFGDIFLNLIGQDGIVLGTSEPHSAGITVINNLRTNIASSANVGRYAINYADTGANSILFVRNCALANVNGRAAPYIFLAGGAAGNQIFVPQCITDLAAGANLIDGTINGRLQLTAAATLAIPARGDTFIVAGNTAITRLTGVYDGRRFTLIFNGTPTVTNGNNIRLAGAVNLSAVVGTVVEFHCYQALVGGNTATCSGAAVP